MTESDSQLGIESGVTRDQTRGLRSGQVGRPFYYYGIASLPNGHRRRQKKKKTELFRYTMMFIRVSDSCSVADLKN